MLELIPTLLQHTQLDLHQLLVVRRMGCRQWKLLEQLAGTIVELLHNTMKNMWNLTLAMPL